MVDIRLDELELAQLMCSRICHDLVGPVGAVNTAVELMIEEGSVGMDGDAAQLLERSVKDAGVRLTVFRRIFGLGGGAQSTMAVDEVRELIAAMAPAGKIQAETQVHGDNGTPPEVLSTYAAKLLMIMAMIGIDALPRGGQLGVHVAGLADGVGLAVHATGPGAAVRDTIRDVLEHRESAEISARNVHAYLASLLSERLSSELELSSDTDAIAIATLVSR